MQEILNFIRVASISIVIIACVTGNNFEPEEVSL
jgi:hypothetical protein